ncbi:MAG TPA: AI-2E family transporter [Gemmatimonadaceae bacterium]|nr:AI-2E family transporter [Gemmatimonadaceae bacterium]
MAPMDGLGTPRDKTVIRAVVLITAMYVVLHLLWRTRSIILTVFLGVLFAIAVSAGADKLQKFRIPRAIGAPFIVLAFLGLLGAFGAWMGPTVREQSTELRTKLPEALEKLENWIEGQSDGVVGTVLGVPDPDSLARAERAAARVPTVQVVTEDEPKGLRERLTEQIGGAGRYFLPVLGSTLAVVAAVLLVLFVTIYVAVNPGMYQRGALRLLPPRNRERASVVLGAIGATLRKWLVTQLIAMVVIGVVTTAVLLALGVRAAIPLGILAGLLEFVPTLGPILSAVPAIAMGFVDSPEKALFVTLAYVGIQFLENHILIPILMKEGIDLAPALTIVVQAVMAILFGFLGLLVAVPLLAVIVVCIRVGLLHEEPDVMSKSHSDPPEPTPSVVPQAST